MILQRSLSGDTSDGVSSRVEACRKRLRMVRGNHKGPIETIERAGVSVTFDVEGSAELSQGPRAVETRAERMDEAGIT